jgi:hypothetical protein
MKISTKLLLLLSAVFLIGFTSCTKVKKTERNLCSKGGKWNNTLYDYKIYYNGSLNYSETYADAGYIIFDKDGAFKSVFIADTVLTAGTGTWSLTYKKITFTDFLNTETYTFIEESKSKFRLEFEKESGDYRYVRVSKYEKAK